MNRILRIILFPIDIILSGFLFFCGLLIGILKRYCFKKRENNIIFLVPGADIESIHKKFGTLNVYLQDNPDFFKKVFRFLWGKNNCILELKKNFLVIEKKISPPFIFYSISKLFLHMSIVALKEKISIIHARDPYICGFLCLILGKFSKVPVCISIHSDYDKRYELDGDKGAPVYFGSRNLALKLEKFVLKNSDLIMPIREHLGVQAISKGADSKKIKIIPHGIDLNLYKLNLSQVIIKQFKNKYQLLNSKKIISFVGRLSKENYIYDIINLAIKLKEIREDFSIVIAGGGNEEDNIKKIIFHERLTQFIYLLGFLPYYDVMILRRISTINLVLMGGFSLIEACASGNPVISYDVEWHYELIKNNETGFLIKESNLKELIDRVNFLLDNPLVAKRMGEEAQKIVFERHSIEKTNEIKREIYKKILENE